MKYCGTICFAEDIETSPSVYVHKLIEKTYYGDVKRITKRYISGDNINENVGISNVISIVADPFMCNRFNEIEYITWMGNKWKVSSVEVAFPRIELTLGGLYNEDKT